MTGATKYWNFFGGDYPQISSSEYRDFEAANAIFFYFPWNILQFQRRHTERSRWPASQQLRREEPTIPGIPVPNPCRNHNFTPKPPIFPRQHKRIPWIPVNNIPTSHTPPQDSLPAPRIQPRAPGSDPGSGKIPAGMESTENWSLGIVSGARIRLNQRIGGVAGDAAAVGGVPDHPDVSRVSEMDTPALGIGNRDRENSIPSVFPGRGWADSGLNEWICGVSSPVFRYGIVGLWRLEENSRSLIPVWNAARGTRIEE